MHANALVIMAKAPVPGQSKTRLVPPLSPQEAAEISRCLLLDLLDSLASFEGADLFVAFSPAEAAPFFQETVPSNFVCFAQNGRDLGERMKNVFDDLMSRGYKNVVLLGSDVPALPAGFLTEAFMVLGKSEKVVVGPSRDGGYYLIGLNRAEPEIFTGVTWSSEDVLALTVKKLSDCGRRPYFLPSWFDIDTKEDLHYLRSTAGESRTKSARRTILFAKKAAL